MVSFTPADNTSAILEQKPLPREIKKDEFSISQELIGEGPCAKVYKGTLDGNPVAIKIPFITRIKPDLIINLAPYWKANHTNIIHLHGMCTEPGQFRMIMELADCNLNTFLEKRIPKNESVSASSIARIELGMAKGIEYLHEVAKFVHGFLTDQNVLLTADLIVKLADFQFSDFRAWSASNAPRNTPETTKQYRAPESFTREYYRYRNCFEIQKTTDIYAYGLLSNQLRTKTRPFPNCSEEKVHELLKDCQRPELHKGTDLFSIANKELIIECLGYMPDYRPTAGQIVQILEKDQAILKKQVNRAFPVLLKNTPDNVFSSDEMRDPMSIVTNFLARLHVLAESKLSP